VAWKFTFAGTELLLQVKFRVHNLTPGIKEEVSMVRIKSSQKLFTEEEVANLTGICLEHLRSLAQNKHLGTLARAAGAAGAEAGKWLFTYSDLSIVTVLQARCEH
jgi:hypothetical protein